MNFRVVLAAMVLDLVDGKVLRRCTTGGRADERLNLITNIVASEVDYIISSQKSSSLICVFFE